MEAEFRRQYPSGFRYLLKDAEKNISLTSANFDDLSLDIVLNNWRWLSLSSRFSYSIINPQSVIQGEASIPISLSNLTTDHSVGGRFYLDFSMSNWNYYLQSYGLFLELEDWHEETKFYL